MSESKRGGAYLPEGFADLEPFVDFWAASGMGDRAHLRDISSAEGRQAFYEGMQNRVADILDFLGEKPLGEYNDREERLLNLALSFGHVALAIEIQGSDEAQHALSRMHMKIG